MFKTSTKQKNEISISRKNTECVRKISSNEREGTVVKGIDKKNSDTSAANNVFISPIPSSPHIKQTYHQNILICERSLSETTPWLDMPIETVPWRKGDSQFFLLFQASIHLA